MNGRSQQSNELSFFLVKHIGPYLERSHIYFLLIGLLNAIKHRFIPPVGAAW